MLSDDVIVKPLRWTRGGGDYVLTHPELVRVLLPPGNHDGAAHVVRRLPDIGFLVRATGDILVVDDRADGRVLEHIAGKLRPYDLTLVSLGRATSEWGLVDQVVTTLTCVTKGRQSTYETPYGTISLMHADLSA